MSLDMFTESDIPVVPDTVPPSPDVQNPCKGCGGEIDVEYQGRGRRPVRCSTCKPARTKTAKSPGTTGSQATLAAQATEALWQINGIASVVAMIAGYHGTSAAIQERESVFRDMAYSALLTDPNACRFILRGGMKTSGVSLVICYAMFAAGIGPTFMEEMRNKKVERARQRAEEGL